jgi:hypothetical protein
LRLGQHQVKVDDLVFSVIADENEKASLSQLHRVLDELPHARVHLFAHHCACSTNPRRFVWIHRQLFVRLVSPFIERCSVARGIQPGNYSSSREKK